MVRRVHPDVHPRRATPLHLVAETADQTRADTEPLQPREQVDVEMGRILSEDVWVMRGGMVQQRDEVVVELATS